MGITAKQIVRIASCVSIVATAGAAVMSAVDTTRAQPIIFKCQQDLKKLETDQKTGEKREVSSSEKAKVIWDYIPKFSKAYWKTGAVVTVGLIAGFISKRTSIGAISALTGSLGIASTQLDKFKKYRGVVEKEFGKDTEHRIATESGLSIPEIYGVIDSEEGEELFYDFDHGRYFASTLWKVKTQAQAFQEFMRSEDTDEDPSKNLPISPNEWYVGYLGLDPISEYDRSGLCWYPGLDWHCYIWEDQITDKTRTIPVHVISVRASLEFNPWGCEFYNPNYSMERIKIEDQLDEEDASWSI